MIRFERLQRETTLHAQPKLTPEPLELTASGELVVLDNRAVFERNGFKFSVDEAKPAGRRLALMSAPFSRTTNFGADDVHEMVFV